MSRKKKPTGYRAPTGSSRPAPAAAETTRPAVPGVLGWLSGPTGDSAWPPIGRSLGRGFATIGTSPLILLSSFLLLFLMWVSLVLLGLGGPPGRLVNLLAIPPISTYFDALNGVTIYGFGPQGFMAATVFLLVRSVVLSLVMALVVRVYEGEGTVGEALARGVRIVPVMIGVNLMGFAMMVAGSIVLPILGPGLGFLASILTLVAALFLFVFAPVVALREPGRPAFEAVRRGARAALMPGSRHLLMCLLYLFLTLPVLVALTPGGALLGVNPDLRTWIYALLCTYVHLSFLAAFAYRLMAVEDEIPDQPVRRRRR